MDKFTIVIPTFTLNKDLLDLTLTGIESYRESCDEIVVIEDGGMMCPQFLELADVYIYNKQNVGFTKNVNRGWKFALSNGADYVGIVNSDTQLMGGNLRDLCVPGKVTSPEIINQYIERLAGPFWVTSKEIAEERGFLIEAMKTYSSDSEYDHRVEDIFERIVSVKIYHEQAQTVKAAGIEGGEEEKRDRNIYANLILEGKAK